MTKNIIIVDKEFERIKYIINNVINSIGENNIKIFVASTIDEVRKICVINNIKLILIFKDLKRIGDIFNKYNILYYRKYY